MTAVAEVTSDSPTPKPTRHRLNKQALLDHRLRKHSELLARQQVATARVNAAAEEIHVLEKDLGLDPTPLHSADSLIHLKED